jgi:hypothetical protein
MLEVDENGDVIDGQKKTCAEVRESEPDCGACRQRQGVCGAYDFIIGSLNQHFFCTFLSFVEEDA